MSGGLLRSFTDEHQWTGACKLGCSANEHEAASLKLIFCFYNWTQLCETVFVAFWMYCVQWVENYDLQQARENLGKRQKIRQGSVPGIKLLRSFFAQIRTLDESDNVA